jgi:hypothetical protein
LRALTAEAPPLAGSEPVATAGKAIQHCADFAIEVSGARPFSASAAFILDVKGACEILRIDTCDVAHKGQLIAILGREARRRFWNACTAIGMAQSPKSSTRRWPTTRIRSSGGQALAALASSS